MGGGSFFSAAHCCFWWRVPGVQKDGTRRELLRFTALQAYFQRLRACKARLAHQEIDALGAFDAALAAIAEALDNVPFPLSNFRHIHRHRSGLHAIVSASPR